MPINSDSIFSGLLPRVFVKSVVVEDTGVYKKEINPHIDFEGEATLNSFANTPSKIEKSNLEYFAAASNKNKDKQLKIILELSVKDIASYGTSFTWIKNFNLQKYLNIYVFPVHAKKILDRGKLKWFKENGFDYFLNNADGKSGAIKIPLSLSGEAHEQNNMLVVKNDSNMKAKPDGKGGLLYEYIFTAVDQPNNSYPAPKHLSYLVFSALDLGAMAADYPDLQNVFFTNKPHGLHADFISPITVQRVFDEHKIVRTSKLYFDENGDQWLGEKHQFRQQEEGGLWMSGRPGAADSRPLTQRIINNYKIKDQRTFDFLSPDIFNFDTLFSDIGKRFSGTNTKLKEIVKSINSSNSAEVSDFWCARDFSGHLRFSFAINYEELLRKNGLFPVLLNNTSVRKSILAKTKVHSMRLRRRRLDKTKNNDSTALLSLIDAPSEDSKTSDSILVEAKDLDHNLSSLTATTPRAQLHVDTSIYPHTVESIRYYRGSDIEMSTLPYGVYQYTIELDMEDGTLAYLRDLYSDMKINRDNIVRYYIESINSGKLETSERFTDTFRRKFLKVLASNDYKYIVPNKFISRYRPTKSGGTKLVKEEVIQSWFPLDVPISYFLKCLQVLQTLSGTTGFNYNDKEVYQTIMSNIHPSSGSPGGVEMFMNLLNKLMANLESLIGRDNVNQNQKTISAIGTPTNSGKKTNKLISYQHTFRKHYKNISRMIGVDYITPFGSNTPSQKLQSYAGGEPDGLKVYGASDLIERARLELERYFTAEFSNQIVTGQLPDLSDLSLTPGLSNPNAGLLTDKNLKVNNHSKLIEFISSLYPSMASDSFAYLTPSFFRFQDGSTVYVNERLTNLSETNTQWATRLVNKIILENSHHHDTCHEHQYSISYMQNILNSVQSTTNVPVSKIISYAQSEKLLNDPRYGSCTINVEIADMKTFFSTTDTNNSDSSQTYLNNLNIQEQLDQANKVLGYGSNPTPEVLEYSLFSVKDQNLNQYHVLNSLLGAKIFDHLSKSPLSTMFNYLAVNQLFNGALSASPESMVSLPFAEGISKVPNHMKQLLLGMTNYNTLTRPIFDKPEWMAEAQVPDSANIGAKNTGTTLYSLPEIEKNVVYMTSPDQYAINWLFYQDFVRLEWFAGFETSSRNHGNTSSTKALMKQEIWQPLDGKSAASLTGKTVLCRIRKIKNSQLQNLGNNVDKLEMPMFNEYFFLTIPAKFQQFEKWSDPNALVGVNSSARNTGYVVNHSEDTTFGSTSGVATNGGLNSDINFKTEGVAIAKDDMNLQDLDVLNNSELYDETLGTGGDGNVDLTSDDLTGAGF